MKTYGLTIALIAFAAASVRADSFDGNWETQTPLQAGCSAMSLRLDASGGKITGAMDNDGSTMSLSGKIKFDGNFTVDVADDHIVLSGIVNGDSFNFRWKGPCGDRPDTGTKSKAQ